MDPFHLCQISPAAEFVSAFIDLEMQSFLTRKGDKDYVGGRILHLLKPMRFGGLQSL